MNPLTLLYVVGKDRGHRRVEGLGVIYVSVFVRVDRRVNRGRRVGMGSPVYFCDKRTTSP